MPQYQPGDVVLLSFPVPGANAVRHRPALVLVDTGEEHVVVARVTSSPALDAWDVQVLAWQEAGLLLPSTISVHLVATLDRYLVERTLGSLARSDWAQVRAALHRLWFDEQAG